MEKTLLALFWALTLFASMASAQSAESNYTLGSGDLIRIQVYGESDLTLEARLTDSGTLSYPFLGEIQVAGRTIDQLQEYITRGLKGDYLINPRVSVTILDYRQFYINGEVKKPGGFAFQPGLTVRKAISIAGGLTERASTDKMFIISEKAPNQHKRVEMNSPVRPGDIITIEQSFF